MCGFGDNDDDEYDKDQPENELVQIELTLKLLVVGLLLYIGTIRRLWLHSNGIPDQVCSDTESPDSLYGTTM